MLALLEIVGFRKGFPDGQKYNLTFPQFEFHRISDQKIETKAASQSIRIFSFIDVTLSLIYKVLLYEQKELHYCYAPRLAYF
jgi:hypothetical protein